MLAASLTLLVLTVAVCYPFTHSLTRLTVIKADSATALLVRDGGHSALLISHSTGLDSVVYDLQREGCTQLDAVVVAEGAPEDIVLLKDLISRTGNPALYTGDSRLWETYSDFRLARMLPGDELNIGNRCRLTALDGCWWRVDTAGGSALLGVDTKDIPPQNTDLTVYTTLPATLPESYCVLTCSEHQLAKKRPTLTNTYWLSQDSITYITRPGKKWSVSSWL